MSTLIRVECASKKESKNWDPKNPIQYTVEFNVPYNDKNLFFQLSGGTFMNLLTVNKEAADQFTVGQSYDIVISKTAPEETQNA